jgi:hypothetical protein
MRKLLLFSLLTMTLLSCKKNWYCKCETKTKYYDEYNNIVHKTDNYTYYIEDLNKRDAKISCELSNYTNYNGTTIKCNIE